MTLSIYYTNPQNQVVQDYSTISAAKSSIDFAAYSLTDAEVINALLERAKAGVTIRLYLDRSELETEAKGNPAMPNSALRVLFGVPNVSILVKKSMVLMHLKSYCVDHAKLRDGSANFSPSGEWEQDNSITITDDSTAILTFESKFAAMWARTDNLTVTQAVQSSPLYAHHSSHAH
jgi:phosphatidylserine/phosphatidylglycerophosphate/cardiolipin synthase-like enzyme